MRKKYVLINNAERERVVDMAYYRFMGITHNNLIEKVPYLRNKIGLIHPKVVEYCSNLEKNLKKSYNENKLFPGMESWKLDSLKMNGIDYVRPRLNKGLIPVLVYTNDFNKNERRQDVMISLLNRDEFILFERVGFNYIYEKINKILDSPFVNKDSYLDQWFALESCLNNSVNIIDKVIPQLSVDRAHEKINVKDVEKANEENEEFHLYLDYMLS